MILNVNDVKQLGERPSMQDIFDLISLQEAEVEYFLRVELLLQLVHIEQSGCALISVVLYHMYVIYFYTTNPN